MRMGERASGQAADYAKMRESGESLDKFGQFARQYKELLGRVNLAGEGMIDEDTFWKVGGQLDQVVAGAKALTLDLLQTEDPATVMARLNHDFIEPILQASEDRYRQIDSRGRLPAERYAEPPQYEITRMLTEIVVATASRSDKQAVRGSRPKAKFMEQGGPQE